MPRQRATKSVPRFHLVFVTFAALRILASIALLLTLFLGSAAVHADDTQPYGVGEFFVHAIKEAPLPPLIAGSRVLWREGAGEVRRIYGRNLSTGQEFMFTTGNDSGEFAADGDLLVASENELGKKGIFAYRLSDFSRLTVAPLAGDAGFYRMGPSVSGNLVVWSEGTNTIAAMDIYGHDLTSGQTFPICTDPALQQWPAVSGKIVVWADRRNATGSSLFVQDLYGYDLTNKREFRITPQPEPIGHPAISGNTVVWLAQHDRAYRILAYDIASGQQSVIATLGYEAGSAEVDIDGNLVVWSSQPGPYGDQDIYGYDLAQKRPFIICRAVGQQVWPRIQGRTVVWADGRHRGLGKYDQRTEIYGANLTPGSFPVPPALGVPTAVDAKVEIVWPHGGAPVTQADQANIAAYLLEPGSLRPAACQWSPEIRLWRAVNNEPARWVATATRQAYTPLWEFNNVDVHEARDPRNKISFFVTVAGTPGSHNVWVHAADARTYFPQQDVPRGIATTYGTVDAKIEIVWPHGGAPVSQAQLANVTANLFASDTLNSLPPDANPTVHLWRSIDNGVADSVAVGRKRLVSQNGVTYPVWDFDNVDVSAARESGHKIYFALSVDGVQSFSNVWAHGADARTYMPQRDTLEGNCS